MGMEQRKGGSGGDREISRRKEGGKGKKCEEDEESEE